MPRRANGEVRLSRAMRSEKWNPRPSLETLTTVGDILYLSSYYKIRKSNRILGDSTREDGAYIR